MPPPGYPHLPQALSTPGTTIAGHLGCGVLQLVFSLNRKALAVPAVKEAASGGGELPDKGGGVCL